MHRVEQFSWRLLGVLLVISGVLVGLDYLGWVGWAKKLAEVPVAPVRMVAADAGVGMANLRRWPESWFKAERKIADLERRIQELTVNANRVQVVEQENMTLRQLVAAGPDPQVTYQPVRVVGRGDQWLIAAGKKQDMHEGEWVVSGAKAVIGKIVRVDETVSTVQLLTDPGSEIAAVAGQGTMGTLKGSVEGKLELVQVVQKDPLEVGMIVVVREGGMVVGTIKKVRQIASEVYKTAEVELLFDPQALFVLVIK